MLQSGDCTQTVHLKMIFIHSSREMLSSSCRVPRFCLLGSAHSVGMLLFLQESPRNPRERFWRLSRVLALWGGFQSGRIRSPCCFCFSVERRFWRPPPPPHPSPPPPLPRLPVPLSSSVGLRVCLASVYLFSVVRLGLIIMTICWIMQRPMACQPLHSPFLFIYFIFFVSCQITGFVPSTSDSKSGFGKYSSVISDDPCVRLNLWNFCKLTFLTD